MSFKEKTYNILKNNRNIIFDRKPISFYNHKALVGNVTRLLRSKLTYHCCELICQHIFDYQSKSLLSLIYQLNVEFDWFTFSLMTSTSISENLLENISKKYHINFVLMNTNPDPYYYGTYGFDIKIIDNNYDTNMVIYTSFGDGYDNDTQISYLIDYIDDLEINELRNAYHEYLFSYENTYIIKDNDDEFRFYNYEKDNRRLINYQGTSYDAAICVATSLTDDATVKINDNKPILLKDYLLYLTRYMINLDVLMIILYENNYYAFGNKGRGFTLIQIRNDGYMCIPNITNKILIANYKAGNINYLMQQPINLH